MRPSAFRRDFAIGRRFLVVGASKLGTSRTFASYGTALTLRVTFWAFGTERKADFVRIQPGVTAIGDEPFCFETGRADHTTYSKSTIDPSQITFQCRMLDETCLTNCFSA
jgi:hypothetical protein